MKRIDRFRLEYDYLSNFYPACVKVDGLEYLSSEAAFQAAKCAKLEDRIPFTELGSNDSKRMGRKVPLRPDWEKVKVREMEKIVRAKFTQNPHLARFLVETGDAELIEGNTWHDVFWGVDLKTGEGENHLGKILMALRKDFQKNGIPKKLEEQPHYRCEVSGDGIHVLHRDITQIPCDCIVHATNGTLIAMDEQDYAVFRAAGSELANACQKLGGCAVTEAKLTDGYLLSAKYVIHTVGPHYGVHGDSNLLNLTYQNVLDLAMANGIHSIAFPAISTGRFSYPKADATKIAVASVRQWKQLHLDYTMKIIFADVDVNIYQAFCNALEKT